MKWVAIIFFVGYALLEIYEGPGGTGAFKW